MALLVWLRNGGPCYLFEGDGFDVKVCFNMHEAASVPIKMALRSRLMGELKPRLYLLAQGHGRPEIPACLINHNT